MGASGSDSCDLQERQQLLYLTTCRLGFPKCHASAVALEEVISLDQGRQFLHRSKLPKLIPALRILQAFCPCGQASLSESELPALNGRTSSQSKSHGLPSVDQDWGLDHGSTDLGAFVHRLLPTIAVQRRTTQNITMRTIPQPTLLDKAAHGTLTTISKARRKCANRAQHSLHE